MRPTPTRTTARFRSSSRSNRICEVVILGNTHVRIFPILDQYCGSHLCVRHDAERWVDSKANDDRAVLEGLAVCA